MLRHRARAREAWLDSLLANRIPKKVGRIDLCHLLTQERRRALGVHRLPGAAAGGFYLVSAGALRAPRPRLSHEAAARATAASSCYPVTTQWGVLVLAGPRSRDVLQKLTDTDLSNEAFPWLSGKKINVGAAEAHALRVNFVGELGWELHHPIEMQNTIFDLADGGGRASSASGRSASGR